MEENQDGNERFKPSWLKKILCIFYCLWRDEGAYQPVSPFLGVKKPQYYQCSAHLYSKSDTDISQSILCNKCNWNALIKKKKDVTQHKQWWQEMPQREVKHPWWCLAAPLQVRGLCFIPSQGVPSKTRSGTHSQDKKSVADDLLALNHQMQKLGGYN